MKQYILDFFKYNEGANSELLKAIQILPEKEAAIKLFSHFITTQNKWMNRITREVSDDQHQWSGTVFQENELEAEWTKSIGNWILFIEKTEETALETPVTFNRQTDGKKLGLSLKDLCLQLNYHCIHHRAQINTLISSQGMKPPVTDYIFTKLKEMPD